MIEREAGRGKQPVSTGVILLTVLAGVLLFLSYIAGPGPLAVRSSAGDDPQLLYQGMLNDGRSASVLGNPAELEEEAVNIARIADCCWYAAGLVAIGLLCLRRYLLAGAVAVLMVLSFAFSYWSMSQPVIVGGINVRALRNHQTGRQGRPGTRSEASGVSAPGTGLR